ncbi:50S ribosomal protein L21 [Planctomycetes bacterium Pan216]|uniref:Large ribosomal subunit protein bL21 n=1 Tax=Kolteria novifilia TaxID=2527975 RepID=A0A518AYR0_9BACT|nr:50S ribosomal protein L21 [Planctomycetes bacterium Pan216]
MYAVVDINSRQYIVEEGQRLLVDLQQDSPGESVEFDRVLLLGGQDDGTVVGKPTIEGAKVVADIVDHQRLKKIQVRTYKRRKNFRRHKGHRQPMTEVQISKIVTP